jgi:hypothetical protein
VDTNMMSYRRYGNPVVVVRAILMAATVVFGLLGLLVREGRLLAAAGAFAVLWTVWDVLWERALGPAGEWAARALTEGIGEPPANTRPSLDDTIRLLERHLERGAPRHVEIQVAIRLEEIYRTIRKDPVAARRVIALVREKYPDAPELARYARASRGVDPTGDG